jgi:membrane protease YdiL (CAAX protease family)
VRSPSLATWIGLGVAFAGPLLLVSPAQRLLGDPARLRTRLLEQLALWAVLAAVVWIVLAWERRPLGSIGVRPFAWSSVAWGLGLAAVLMWVVTPLSLRLLGALRLAGFESGIASFAALPLALKLFAVLGAGVVEETLYRGYALERLAEASGSWLLAGALTLACFALIHLPMWGWGPVLTLFVSGAVLTAFYVWRQDLLANVVAHVVVDAMGLVVVPSLQRGGGS